MKKVLFLSTLIAAVLLASSCQKEQELVTLGAVISQTGKTYIDDRYPCWNNGDHASCGKLLPPDMKATINSKLLRYTLNECFPAFTNSSTDKNYGNGSPDDGDVEGWLSRGFTWEKPVDKPESLEMAIKVDFPGIAYPVTTDITFRRRQQFRPAVGETVGVTIGKDVRTATIDGDGLLTLKGVVFPDAAPLKIVFNR